MENILKIYHGSQDIIDTQNMEKGNQQMIMGKDFIVQKI